MDPHNRISGVIVVDDSMQLADVYARYFERYGLRVLGTFFDGEEVVNYFESMYHDTVMSELPSRSLILMDYGMPVMNGIEAAKRIREMEDGDPTIILTTADDISELRIPDGLFDGVIRKPFSMEDFFDLIRETSVSKRQVRTQLESTA